MVNLLAAVVKVQAVVEVLAVGQFSTSYLAYVLRSGQIFT